MLIDRTVSEREAGPAGDGRGPRILRVDPDHCFVYAGTRAEELDDQRHSTRGDAALSPLRIHRVGDVDLPGSEIRLDRARVDSADEVVTGADPDAEHELRAVVRPACRR
jgi:hypothetical protein